METYHYICEYCSKEYVPRRRKIQKYCSDTCRVKAHYHKNKPALPKQEKGLSQVNKTEKKTKEKINIAGIGNAAIANLGTDILKNIFTNEDNKPATKGDLKKMIAQFKNRYEKVQNANKRPDGSEAYFDNERKEVVYLKTSLPWS